MKTITWKPAETTVEEYSIRRIKRDDRLFKPRDTISYTENLYVGQKVKGGFSVVRIPAEPDYQGSLICEIWLITEFLVYYNPNPNPNGKDRVRIFTALHDDDTSNWTSVVFRSTSNFERLSGGQEKLSSYFVDKNLHKLSEEDLKKELRNAVLKTHNLQVKSLH